jgi:shikimate kinase
VDTDDDGDAENPRTVVVSGTVDNKGRFYGPFDHVVLLSAPLSVLLDRVSSRTTNPYGATSAQRPEITGYVETVEPLLRRGATVELDTTADVSAVADAVEHLL